MGPATRQLEQRLIKIVMTIIVISLSGAGLFVYFSFAVIIQEMQLIALVADEASSYPEHIPVAENEVESHARKTEETDTDFSKVHDIFFTQSTAVEALMEPEEST
ncbi:hypothetical protein IH979_00790 [Patescibacteria group bacterium]|nr:hypothetical protein [Patescibacteria group bacterium]